VSRPRVEARARRGPGDRALCHRPGRPGRSRRRCGELPPPRPRGRIGPLRVLRGARLHAAQDRGARRRDRAGPITSPRHPCLLRPSPGHEPGRARERRARRPMVRRFHSDPRVQATEPLLQERVPRFVPSPGRVPPRPHGPSRPFPRPRRGASAPRTRSTRAPTSSRTAITPRSSPMPGAVPAPGAGSRSPGSATIPPATRAASSSTCATCAAAGCGPPPTSRCAASPNATV
jgi:hypothetical protein